jgi:hypothetical protein
LTDNGQVRILPFKLLRSIVINDSQSEHDLSYFLDTSMSEDDRRVVAVRLSEGEHDLVASYVAPTPTWRVSYRIVAESDADGATGTALLQGWGLFDNRLDEDLIDVHVTLVAGQPISFIYDLYASKIPQRPMVEDQARVAPVPIEFDGELADVLADSAEPVAGAAYDMSAPAPAVRSLQKVAHFSRAGLAKATAVSAETRDSGEFFQYVVSAPVSVKRGESALVPIIGREINYQRELLYNSWKLPDHPVAALRFDNITGLTLERGPVTVVEDGDYKGEAVIPFTRDGNEVYVPYAVELGVTVTENWSDTVETAGVAIDNGYFVYEDYAVYAYQYALVNTTDADRLVTIEASKRAGNDLYESREPDVETPQFRRWRIEVPAHGQVDFTWKERLLRRRSEAIRKFKYANLSAFLENHWLDGKTMAQLREMLETLDAIENDKLSKRELGEELKHIYVQQEQLRANMGALSTAGDEAAFRKRIVGQLEESQNRVDAIGVELKNLNAQIEANEAKVNAIIAAMGKPPEPPPPPPDEEQPAPESPTDKAPPQTDGDTRPTAKVEE